MINWHSLSAKETAGILGADLQVGLSSDEARRRLDQYGPNELEHRRPKSVLTIFLQQFMSPLIYILFAAAIISLALGHIIDAEVILFVVLANALIGTFQEGKAVKAVESLRQLVSPEATVIRGGERRRINASNLVPGDLLEITAGDKIPADARLIDIVRLKVNESALTGEADAADKFNLTLPQDITLADRDNMAYAGTVALEGHGKGLVTETGMRTEVGHIAARITGEEQVKTPLQRRIAAFGNLLVLAVPSIGLLIIIVGVLRGFRLLEIFLVAVSLTVSAIPEGLPAVITVILALGMRRMAERKAVVRKLMAVEALGTATVICSDKTGTLTKNEMTVTELYTGIVLDVTGAGYSTVGEFLCNGYAADLGENIFLLLKAAVLANDAELKAGSVIGDPTEGALLVVSIKAGILPEEVRSYNSRIDEIPFSAERRYMATLNDDLMGGRYIYAKGSPESVLSLCNRFIDLNGKIKPLDKAVESNFLKQAADMAGRALRVLGFAFSAVDTDQEAIGDEIGGMAFIGLAGMIDPPRPEAIGAVSIVREAGIRVIMITGDHKLTATAIARQLGIYDEGDLVLGGHELEELTDEELEEKVGIISVYARVSPLQKLRIVKAWQKNGAVVAMTGDGVNDAPAINRADIGIAMGITGTDVAKEAAKMVLLDDNFATIEAAVEEGRTIYTNLKKVILYLFSTNLGEVVTILVSVLAGLPLPLLPVQILWINLATDGVAVIPLGLEPMERGVMKEPPRDPEESLLTADMLIFIIFVSLIMATGTLLLFHLYASGQDFARARTIAFTAMVTFQLFNAFSCKSVRESVLNRNLLNNRFLIGAVLFGFILQMGALYLPFGNHIFRTVPLDVPTFLLTIGITALIIPALEIIKLLFLREQRAA
ncbi:MAG: HAD-IC family P-type ATPase [bacterium]|jgi:Ca2+-transporting ATPase|nr:HAD-IC family P-type ATPase [bacterium]MDD4558010.1 HAD-IC family P-type ATPase [bacterium]